MSKTEPDWDAVVAECVRLTQRLIQTPSMPRQEATLAQLLAEEMRRLAFDDVWMDEIGNVAGRLHGRDRTLPALVLNAHLDHVDPGDLQLWPFPPYEGAVDDGRVHGRGACDIKGPLAVQVTAMSALMQAGLRPRRDVVFSGVVEEEIGGAGARHWVEHLDYEVALVMLAEPSNNRLALGHRGSVQMWLTFHGRSVHASVPEKGENPNFALASFLNRLREATGDLAAHPILGPTTVAPTVIQVDTVSGNVTPAWTRVLLDFRTATESVNGLQAFVDRLAADWPHRISNAWDEDPEAPLPDSDEPVQGFFTPPDSPQVARVLDILGRALGSPPETSTYEFATDGRLIVPYGIPVLGYSPGEEWLAHTVDESIAIDKMREGLKGYYALLRDF